MAGAAAPVCNQPSSPAGQHTVLSSEQESRHGHCPQSCLGPARVRRHARGALVRRRGADRADLRPGLGLRQRRQDRAGRLRRRGRRRDGQACRDQHQRNSVRALRRSAAETLALIKVFAENQANPNAVYDDAQIPPPATPSPAPAPGTPYKFAVTLEDSGAITLKFKCDNPAGTTGTIYEVRRRIGTGALTFIGASGIKSFTDETLPTGSANVVYQITAVRSTARGPSASFNVNFGVGGDGVMFAKVGEVTTPSPSAGE